ncbi:MAG: type I DNA topoisomerase [Syntrophobacteraceae bacterium]|nr:type I DNA topoisomerase [Syntrophobacteraceae bacterium]
MAKSLLIVESPTKARTLGRYLGKQFMVKASVGHIKDLPKNKLGIDLDHDFYPDYQVIRGKKKIIHELKEAAENAQAIYLGPDPDREGEAIAWHIADEVQIKDKPVYRVLFHELTQGAIQKALENPLGLNRSLYEAQQTRRILDRLVGYLISPILWRKVKRGLSAGRVQSVALRLLCERENEIWSFESKEYWTIEARMIRTSLPPGIEKEEEEPRSFTAQLWRCRNKKCQISTGEEARRWIEALRSLSYQVQKVEKKKRAKTPPPPFITSTLQQDAARKFHFPARRTMSIAQKLYEGVELGEEGAVGLITYMRTDSTRLSQEAVQAARAYIEEAHGKDYLPSKPLVYKTKGRAQDAHEAIRPTDVRRTPEKMARFLSKEEARLYSLIWKRFVACQMAPALYAQTTVDISAGEYLFRAVGSVLEFEGYQTLYTESRDNGEDADEHDARLPELKEGQPITLEELIPKQHFTQPPPRFSEAGLIRELEELGIGRPSTYAGILSTIVDREYCRVEQRRLVPTELGRLINHLLVENFPDIVDVEFTAKMEKSLDEVESGRYPYLKLLEDFYSRFAQSLQTAEKNMLNLRLVGRPTDEPCPTCGRPLHIRLSRNGPFVACSAYPACPFSSDYERNEKGGIVLISELDTNEKCEKCGKPMVLRKGRFGTFLACSGYPACKNTRSPGTGLPCPQEGCDGELVERVGKGGRRFYGCNRYPQCKTAFWDQPVAGTCPRCGSPILLEKVMKNGSVKQTCPRPECKFEKRFSAKGETDRGEARE